MFWRSRPEFTETDASLIVNNALPDVIKELKEPVYLTSSSDRSLVTESYVAGELEQLVLESSEPVDVSTLVEKTHLPRKIIEPLLINKVVSKNGLFFDGAKVLTPKRIAVVGSEIRSNDEILSLGEVCQRYNLTIKAAEYIFKGSNGISGLILSGDVVIPEELLLRHQHALEEKISSAKSPIKYSDIEQDNRILPLLKKRLGIQSHEIVYVPQSFIDTQISQADAQMDAKQYVELNDFSGETIKQAVIKHLLQTYHSSKQLGPFVVSEDLIKTSHKQLDSHLSEHQWFDTRDLPLQPYLANYILDENDKYRKLQSKNKPAILVKPSLEKSAISFVVDAWKPKILQQVDAVDFSKVDGSSSLASFADRVSLPTAKELQNDVVEMAPAEIGLSNHITPSVRKQLADFSTNKLQPKFEDALRRAEAKVRAYLNGCISIEKVSGSENGENSTLSMVWDEFQQYVSEHQFSVPENITVALSQFPATDDLLAQTVADLQQSATAKINKLGVSAKSVSKDAAPLLHLAVVVFHSRKLEPNSFLKIRGKAVPRVVKLFDFRTSFSELRANIKSPGLELLQKVKEDALA